MRRPDEALPGSLLSIDVGIFHHIWVLIMTLTYLQLTHISPCMHQNAIKTIHSLWLFILCLLAKNFIYIWVFVVAFCVEKFLESGKDRRGWCLWLQGEDAYLHLEQLTLRLWDHLCLSLQSHRSNLQFLHPRRPAPLCPHKVYITILYYTARWDS